MAVALRQQSTTADGSANLTLTTAALGSPTVAGDCIVAVVESFIAAASSQQHHRQQLEHLAGLRRGASTGPERRRPHC